MRLAGVDRMRGLGRWNGPFWSRVVTSLVFFAGAVAQWLIRHDGAFAAVWCFIALIPATLAFGLWREIQGRRVRYPADPEAHGNSQ